MNTRLTLALFFSVAVVTGCGGGSVEDRTVDTPPATNNDGSTVTKVFTPVFDPANGVIPLPNTLLRSGTTDLTLNFPVDDPTNFGDPLVALSALDGWSTTEKWAVTFVEGEVGASDYYPPATVDPNSVIPGATARFFEVTMNPLTGAVIAVNREMTPGVDFVAVGQGNAVAFLPLKPLKELTGYMALLTDGVKDTEGNNATPSQTYFLAKRTSPLIDAAGNSTDPLLPNSTAQALEPLRRLIQTHLGAAASVGIDPDDVTVSWTAITQGITPVNKYVRAVTQPAPAMGAPTGVNTAAIGAAGLADISVGIITLPYYMGVPSAENPTAPLTSFWKAAPGAYVAPFDAYGLDPTSTHVTTANPFPVLTDMQTVPLLITTPGPNSGHTKPEAGWPVVIFGHGLTGNRTNALGIADTMASLGYAVIAMDFPVHGISPDVQPELGLFYVENTPFGPIANERTFDMDFLNNATGAPGPDGLIDASGAHAISAGLSSMLTGRDTIRQGIADLSVLAVSIPFIDINGDSLPDFDGSNIAYTGMSWGGIHGTAFTAIEPMVNRSVLNVPGGGIARFAEASPTFGPIIRAGLKAAAGLEPGTADYELFFLAWQTVLDSADPINWIADATNFNAVLLQEVIGDTVIPNGVPTAPLSGTEPMIAVGGLTGISSSAMDAAGLRVATRFTAPATHSSLLSPAAGSPAATAEMQGQMASFIYSFGTAVQVSNPSVLVPQ